MTEIELACAGCGEDVRDVILTAAEFALRAERAPENAYISVTVVDNGEIRGLNLEYRGIDRPTDVLSFPANEGEEILAPPDGFLGDIVISYQRAGEQAEEYGHSLERELSFLTIHGTLHLLGYDHIEDADRAVMEKRQKEILDEMGITR